MYVYIYMYIYIYIYYTKQDAVRLQLQWLQSAGPMKEAYAEKKTFLLREPWPCDPVAETAIKPLSWCYES